MVPNLFSTRNWLHVRQVFSWTRNGWGWFGDYSSALHLLCTYIIDQLQFRSSGIRYWRLGTPALKDQLSKGDRHHMGHLEDRRYVNVSVREESLFHLHKSAAWAVECPGAERRLFRWLRHRMHRSLESQESGESGETRAVQRSHVLPYSFPETGRVVASTTRARAPGPCPPDSPPHPV